MADAQRRARQCRVDKPQGDCGTQSRLEKIPMPTFSRSQDKYHEFKRKFVEATSVKNLSQANPMDYLKRAMITAEAK